MIDVRFMIRDGEHIRDLCGSFDTDATVLDALETLRADRACQPGQAEGQSPVPAYRHSCHHGSCGTCGAIINGLEGLMCLTRLGELASPRPRIPGGPKLQPELDADGVVIVRLEPFRRGSLVAGLAARPAQSLAGIPSDLPYLMPVIADSRIDGKADSKAGGKADLPGDPTRPAPEIEENEKSLAPGGALAMYATSTVALPPSRVRFEACIECGLCSSSCPVTAAFKGPAALAALNRQRQKRPESAEAMLALAGTPDGAAACERHLACSRVCPQQVFPGKHIQLLKNALGGKS